MNRAVQRRRVIPILLSLGIAAFLVTAALPHSHGDAASAHSAHACRVCKLHEAFSATPPPDLAQLVPVVEAAPAWDQTDSPRTALIVSFANPRAPPRLS